MEYIILCFHYCGAELWSRLLLVSTGEQLSVLLLHHSPYIRALRLISINTGGLVCMLRACCQSSREVLIAEAVHKTVTQLK